MYITLKKIKAWFSVTKNLSATFGLTRYPFAFMSQFFNAEKILIVDHVALHQIAEKIDKLEGNCVLINSTGRSGSTLICQVSYPNVGSSINDVAQGTLFILKGKNCQKSSWDFEFVLHTSDKY